MQCHAAGVTDQGLSEARIRSEERFQLKSFYKKSTSSANYLQNVLQRLVCKQFAKSMKERTNKHQKSLKSSVAPTIFLQIIHFVTENATLSIVLRDRNFLLYRACSCSVHFYFFSIFGKLLFHTSTTKSFDKF